jgi:hypothetical protein
LKWQKPFQRNQRHGSKDAGFRPRWYKFQNAKKPSDPLERKKFATYEG